MCDPDNLTLFHMASLSTSSYNSYLKVPQGALFSEVNNHIRGKTPTITGQVGKKEVFPHCCPGQPSIMTSWEGLGKEKRKNENMGRNNKTQTLRERRQKLMNVVVEHKHMGVKTSTFIASHVMPWQDHR